LKGEALDPYSQENLLREGMEIERGSTRSLLSGELALEETMDFHKTD
jgi:hypothetical protein